MKIFLHPNFIKFEKPENKLFLTVSALIKKEYRKDILDIQNRIEKIIKEKTNLKNLSIEKDKDNLSYNKIINRGDFIYRYPEDTFHFSIANFLTYNIVEENFNDSKEIIREDNTFKSALEKARNFKNKLGTETIKTEIKRIYIPGGIESSIAVNVFPEQSFLEKLKEKRKFMETELVKDLIYNDFGIKAYPQDNFQYFALNIFRFISKKESKMKNKNLRNELLEINKNLNKNPITAEFKINIVISNPYLSNKNPTFKEDK